MFWLGVVTPFLVALMVSTVVAVTYGTMWLIHKAHHSCLKPLRLTPRSRPIRRRHGWRVGWRWACWLADACMCWSFPARIF